MNHFKKSKPENKKSEQGAALVTVLFISLLLLTASAAMLTAVGSNSRNTTDILSETKAYYAAETGLQASINVLRNVFGPTEDYSDAVNDPDLSTWLPAYVSGQVPIGTGTGTGYSILVSNPDNGAVTYSTAGKFTGTSVGELRQPNKDGLCIPDSASVDGNIGDWTEITISGSGGAQTPTTPNTIVGAFTVLKGGSGAATTIPPNTTTFRIDYRILTPRVGVASIYGTVERNAASTMTVGFQSPEFRLMGNTIRLCSAQNTGSPCPVVTLSISDVTPLSQRQVFASSNPSFSPDPYRLVITSTGYGPNGAVKKLESIVQRNFFDGFEPPATMSLIGPHNDAYGGTFHFVAGSSDPVTYSGGDCNTRCIPSFGVSDVNPAEAQLNLNDINAAILGMGTPPVPGSQLVDFANLPTWLQSPAALDAVIDRLRVTAQHSNRYFTGGNHNNPGDNASGTGITFCEGSCTVRGSGGGLLVVTGQVTANGNFSFRGLILVTGQGGWTRSGGGNGNINGAIVIAPYNRTPYVPENHSSTFLAPSYDISGGGNSIIANVDINPFIDNTMAVSDIMAGVAEK